MTCYNPPSSQIDRIELEIDQLFDEIIFHVNQRREAILTEYRTLRGEIASRALARTRKVDELIGARTEMEGRLQMNELREVQEKILSEIDQKLTGVRTPLPNTRAVFTCQSNSLKQLIASFGDVIEKEVLTLPNYRAMTPVVSAVKKGRAPGELYYPHGVAIDSSKRIFVAEAITLGTEHHARISVFSERGEFMLYFRHQDMRCPRGLAIHRDSLYVTDVKMNAIFQFKVEEDFPLLSKQGTFSFPISLSVSTHGEVYVADYSENKVQILNSSLHFLRNLTEQLIVCPYDIKLTADEVYVLCDDSPCLHVFSHTGERLRSMLSRQVNNRSYFCLDPVDNIIISDSGTETIKIFTKDGNHLLTIGEGGSFDSHQRAFYLPRGLALTKDLNLVVVSHRDNSCLQIFSSL